MIDYCEVNCEVIIITFEHTFLCCCGYICDFREAIVVVHVRKKDSSARFYADHRKLNLLLNGKKCVC